MSKFKPQVVFFENSNLELFDTKELIDLTFKILSMSTNDKFFRSFDELFGGTRVGMDEVDFLIRALPTKSIDKLRDLLNSELYDIVIKVMDDPRNHKAKSKLNKFFNLTTKPGVHLETVLFELNDQERNELVDILKST